MTTCPWRARGERTNQEDDLALFLNGLSIAALMVRKAADDALAHFTHIGESAEYPWHSTTN